MIVPDVNLLVYAYNAEAPHHAGSRAWWEAVMNGERAVRIPWVVSLGFVRLMTHRRVVTSPLPPAAAIGHVRSWLDRSHVAVLEPGPRHLQLLDEVLRGCGIAGSLTTDAHIAALALEHNCAVYSNDADFGRFAGLKWVNPLD